MRRAMRMSLALAMVAAAPALADGDQRKECTYRTNASVCFPYGCVAEDESETSNPLFLTGQKGFCALCRNDDDCGGTMCNTQTGICAKYTDATAPGAVWPHFHLLVLDASVNLFDGTDARPILGTGYIFQGALGKARPVVRVDTGRGWVEPDLPTWYFSVGGSLALAGSAQNLFVDGGLTAYVPSWPFAITTVTFGFLYQRQGTSIWNVLDATENTDRIGPQLNVGFLQNLFLRASYQFSLRGPNDHGALILSVVYMRDLLGDLMPDRFEKYLPESLH